MLTSRVHPGETGASWMIHGVMDTLLNPSTDEEKILVKNLKDHFEFLKQLNRNFLQNRLKIIINLILNPIL
jgi:hypothetical protein